MVRSTATLVLVLSLAGCGTGPAESPAASFAPGSFGDDLQFLRSHTDIVVLTDAEGAAQVAVAPGYQGRVMTSTAAGLDGPSFGYIHRPVIGLGTRQPHMTVLGGEDRFWLGPEGGQFGLYFSPGSAFDTASWQVPEPIDWGPWPVVSATAREVTFAQPMTVENYAGTAFTIRVDRTVRVLERAAIADALGAAIPPSADLVGYESDNRITNAGRDAWRPDTGLVSIWILGMLRPAPRTTVVVPYEPGPERERGPVVNAEYFGVPPPERLHVGERAVFFRGDGRSRGKIGLPKARARNVAGSYDPDSGVLTLVQFTVPESPHGYVNSMWAHQEDPFGGDVMNAYNDGPLGPGEPALGPFYEIESSSPAAALAPGESMQHVHRTVHLRGAVVDLDVMARAVLGVSLDEIVNSLP
jgi:hypothetical protein